MVDQKEIIRFVNERLFFEPTPATKFFWDTGAAGLDTDFFMQEFADHYEIDMSDFDGAGFGMDDVGLGTVVDDLKLLLRGKRPAKSRYFTIEHLVDVANGRKWFDPMCRSTLE